MSKQRGAASHTPGPWEVYEHKRQNGITSYSIIEGGKAKFWENWTLAGLCHTTQDKANAEFIVRACNAHEDLLAALVEYTDRHEASCDPRGLPEYDRACAAIAKAKGGT